MQRILHSYLRSACHAFQDRERWIVSEVRELQSHLCTQEYDSSHSFQWSPTFTRTDFKETSYSHLACHFVLLIKRVCCLGQETQRDSLNLCIICLYFYTLVSNAAFRRCVYFNRTYTGVLLCSAAFLSV